MIHAASVREYIKLFRVSSEKLILVIYLINEIDEDYETLKATLRTEHDENMKFKSFQISLSRSFKSNKLIYLQIWLTKTDEKPNI